MYNDEDKTKIDIEDQCSDCKHSRRGDCILMQLFYYNLITLNEDITIDNCIFFEENTRLKLVTD